MGIVQDEWFWERSIHIQFREWLYARPVFLYPIPEMAMSDRRDVDFFLVNRLMLITFRLI